MKDNSSGITGILGIAVCVALFLAARKFFPSLATLMLWLAGIAGVVIVILLGLVIYFSVTGKIMQVFMDERIERFGKPFIRINSLSEIRGDIVYFAVLGDEEKIRRAAAEAQKLSSVHLTYYRDAYSENVWYLEIFHESASKKHAVQFLREYTGAGRVIVFGDNLNDLPMFEEADLSVAVENAAPQVKEAADFITDDVVSFIENYIKTEI